MTKLTPYAEIKITASKDPAGGHYVTASGAFDMPFDGTSELRDVPFVIGPIAVPVDEALGVAAALAGAAQGIVALLPGILPGR